MSLQVWLPLDNNIKNIGLKNVTCTALGNVNFEDGKIGKAFSRGSTYIQDGISLNTNFLDMFNGNKTCSVAVWVKPAGNHVHYNGTILSSGNWNTKTWAFGVNQDNTKVDVFCNKYNTYVNCSVPVNEWTHLVSVYDNRVCKLYKNGVYVASYTASNDFDSDAQNTCVGRETYGNGYFGFNGMINDLRIYDHCLSPQEIREIYQSLVLHYKLDGIEPNHIPFDFTVNNWGQYNYASGQTTSSLEHGVYHVNGYQQDTNKDTLFYLTSRTYITLEPDTDYWLSFDCVVSNSLYNIYFGTNTNYYYTGFKNSSGTMIKPVSQVTLGQNFSGRVNLKIHTDSDTQYKIRLGFDTPNLNGVGSYMEFSNVMITKIQQNYVPYWYTDNMIYDCSGYSNNGISTGQIQLDNNTVRYNNCTKILANNSYITFPTRKLQEFTYSFWVKRDRVSHTQRESIIANNDFTIGFDIDNKLSFLYSFGTNSTRILSSNTIFNDTTKWYYITITRNSSQVSKIYVNGILDKTASSDSGNVNYNLDSMTIGVYTNQSYQFLGSISDLRIYATALTQEDILDLYHTSAMIDNLGSIHSFDFVEDSINNQEMYDTGIFKTKHFIESNDNLLIDSDGSVFLKILHHNNPASNLFTQENAWLNNDPNLFSNLIILKDSPIFSQLSEYEFIAKEKLTTSSEEVTYRWKQSTNPAALNTTSTEYQVIYGNPPRSLALMNKGTKGAIHNGTPWWCCCGSWSRYNGGNRGFSGVVTTGYSELYIKIPETLLRGYIDETAKFYTNSAYSKQFLEI